MATSVMGEMNMGNSMARAGIEPTSLASSANVLIIIPHRLPDVTTYGSTWLPVYAAPCLGGQCIVLHSPRNQNLPD